MISGELFSALMFIDHALHVTFFLTSSSDYMSMAMNEQASSDE